MKLRNFGIAQQAGLAKRLARGYARDDDDQHVFGRVDRTGHATAVLHLTMWRMC